MESEKEMDVNRNSDQKSIAERERSTIQFPYMNLSDALSMCKALHANVGQGEASEDQLAAWLDLSSKSSGFRIRVATAKLFGVVETSSDGLRLSNLGRAAMDPSQERRAKAEAFLSVPLYRLVYEKYKGGVVPPATAFESDIRAWGVAPKQASRARQALERSADEAGFYQSGRNRLIVPAAVSFKASESSVPAINNDAESSAKSGQGKGSDDQPLDPILEGLIKRLPAVNSVWPEAERELWLEILRSSLKLVYRIDGPREGGE